MLRLAPANQPIAALDHVFPERVLDIRQFPHLYCSIVTAVLCLQFTPPLMPVSKQPCTGYDHLNDDPDCHQRTTRNESHHRSRLYKCSNHHGFTSCLEHILSSFVIVNYDEVAVMSDHPTQLYSTITLAIEKVLRRVLYPRRTEMDAKKKKKKKKKQYYNHVHRLHTHIVFRVFPLSSFLFCQRSPSLGKCRQFHEQSSVKLAVRTSSMTAGFSLVSFPSPTHTRSRYSMILIKAS